MKIVNGNGKLNCTAPCPKSTAVLLPQYIYMWVSLSHVSHTIRGPTGSVTATSNDCVAVYDECAWMGNVLGHFHDDVIKWKHFSALLVLCAGNSLVTGEFPSQRPVTRSFDVFFGPRPNKQLSKQSWGWWIETPPCPLWRHCNVVTAYQHNKAEWRWCASMN